MIAVSMALSSHQADAADGKTDGAEKDSNWIVTLGANIEWGPRFPGSGSSGFSAIPSFDFRRFGEPDENGAPDDNLDYALLSYGGLELGPVVGFRDGRSMADDSRLSGLESIKWGVDLGLFAQYWFVPNQMRVRAEIRQAVSNGSGLVADLGADWFQAVGDRWVWTVGPRASFGSDSYMGKYFSVSARESATSGTIAPFNASGGLTSIGFLVSAAYSLTPDWTFQVYDRFDRLVNDAGDSPITALGSRNQNVIGISVSRSFNISF